MAGNDGSYDDVICIDVFLKTRRQWRVLSYVAQ